MEKKSGLEKMKEGPSFRDILSTVYQARGAVDKRADSLRNHRALNEVNRLNADCFHEALDRAAAESPTVEQNGEPERHLFPAC